MVFMICSVAASFASFQKLQVVGQRNPPLSLTVIKALSRNFLLLTSPYCSRFPDQTIRSVDPTLLSEYSNLDAMNQPRPPHCFDSSSASWGLWEPFGTLTGDVHMRETCSSFSSQFRSDSWPSVNVKMTNPSYTSVHNIYFTTASNTCHSKLRHGLPLHLTKTYNFTTPNGTINAQWPNWVNLCPDSVVSYLPRPSEHCRWHSEVFLGLAVLAT